jgi:beta-lactamase regulating signal transducer with metallopeptidase domain
MELSSLLKSVAWTFAHSFWLGLLVALIAAGIISSTKRSSARLRYNLLSGVMLIFLGAVAIVFIKEMQSVAYQPTPEVANIISDGFVRTAIEFDSAAGNTGMFSGFEIWFNENLNVLMLIWAVFFAWNSFRLIWGYAAVQRLRVQKIHSMSDEWIARFEFIKEQLGIRQSIGLLQSELVKVPVAIGFFKPLVLLPLGMIANIPVHQVEAILMHELGHIRRKDFLINLVQHFVDAVFFFNPAVRWISSLIRQEREACCDDIVVSNTSQKRNYVDALISFQEYSLQHPSYVMAISSRKNYLFNRIRRIATNENKKLNIMEKLGLLAGILIFSAFTVVNKPMSFGETSYFKAIDNATEIAEVSLDYFISNNSDNSSNSENENDKRTGNATMIVDTIPMKKKENSNEVKEKLKEKEIAKKELKEVKANAKAELKEKPVEAKNDPVNQKLEEIRLIKEEIQASKDIIGEKTKALNEPDSKKRQAIEMELKKERDELEQIRDRLENKRAELAKAVKDKKNAEGRKPTPRIGAKDASPVVKKDSKKLFSSKKSKLFENKTRKLNLDVKKNKIKIAEVNSVKKIELKEKLISKPKLKEKPAVPGEPQSPVPAKPKIVKPSTNPSK